MKKNFLLGFIAFAAMAVTSCTNDDVNEFIPQGKAIEFGTYVGRDAQSRGSQIDATAIKAGFGVLAYQYQTKDAFNANFMNNVEVKDDGSGWDYGTKKYWPNDKSNKIDFLAYAPYTVDASSQVSLSGTTIELTVPTTPVADQKDLVVATPVEGQNSGTVALTFSHMLSRIAFYAMAANTYDAEITITNISLTGKFHNEGTVDLAADSPAITGTEVVSPNLPSDKTYVPSLTGTALSTTLAMQNKSTDYLMLIPAAAQDLTLSITYTVDGVTNTIPYSIKNQAFTAGQAYAINMVISLGEIAFTVSVTPWDEPGTEIVPVG